MILIKQIFNYNLPSTAIGQNSGIQKLTKQILLLKNKFTEFIAQWKNQKKIKNIKTHKQQQANKNYD